MRLFAATLAMASSGLGYAGEEFISGTARADFVQTCIPSCIKRSAVDPVPVQWKMTDAEVLDVCGCYCNESADHVPVSLVQMLVSKGKAAVEASTEFQRIVQDAQKVCYAKFFSSRSRTPGS